MLFDSGAFCIQEESEEVTCRFSHAAYPKTAGCSSLVRKKACAEHMERLGRQKFESIDSLYRDDGGGSVGRAAGRAALVRDAAPQRTNLPGSRTLFGKYLFGNDRLL